MTTRLERRRLAPPPALGASRWPHSARGSSWFFLGVVVALLGGTGSAQELPHGSSPYAYTQTPSYVMINIIHYSPPSTAASPPPQPASVEVRVPASALLWFQGQQTEQTGERRTFTTPPLPPGQTYTYEVQARWYEKGEEVTERRQIRVVAGAKQMVDFAAPTESETRAVAMEIRDYAEGVVPAADPRSPRPAQPMPGNMSVTDVVGKVSPRPRRYPGAMSVMEFEPVATALHAQPDRLPDVEPSPTSERVLTPLTQDQHLPEGPRSHAFPPTRGHPTSTRMSIENFRP